jgi:hypothetical protein
MVGASYIMHQYVRYVTIWRRAEVNAGAEDDPAAQRSRRLLAMREEGGGALMLVERRQRRCRGLLHLRAGRKK